MSVRGGNRQGRAAVAGSIALLATATLLCAAEEPKTPDAGLAAAKRDYAAIKAASAGVEQQNLALPNSPLVVPELKTRSIDSSSNDARIPVGKPALEKDRLRKAKRSSNWLLEAMAEKKTGPGDDNVNSRESDVNESPARANDRENDFLANAATLAREEKVKEERSRDEKADAPERALATSANPLGRYMAGWMTTRDFELLRGAADKSAIDSSIASRPASPESTIQISADPGVSTFSRASDSLSALGESASPTAPANNPYLTDLPNVAAAVALPPAPAALEFAAPTPANPPSALISPAPEPVAGAKTDTYLDELRKARDDEKYFKQLKRF